MKARLSLAIYREVQRFRQPWLWLVICASSAALLIVFGYAMYQQFVLDRPWGDEPFSDAGLAIFGGVMMALGIALLYLFYTIRLETEVREDGVYVRFWPFPRRRIPYDRIARCEARTYRPIAEYGGWGIRGGRSGMAYNVSGNRGVQLELKDGKRILIGSQDADRLAAAIREWLK